MPRGAYPASLVSRSWRRTQAPATRSRQPSSGNVLEDLDHTLHAAGRAGDVGGCVALAAAHDPHQVDDAALGDDLHVVDLESVGFHEARLDLRGYQRVVGARPEVGDRTDGELVLNRAHLGRGADELGDIGTGGL